MQHSLFRYFDREDRAEAFLEGKVFCHNLQFYVNLEDGYVRGDAIDGSLVYQPSRGLEINNLTQGTTFTLPDTQFNAKASIEDIYALCLSQSRNEQISKEFKAAYCIEIQSKRQFLNAVRNELEEKGHSVYAGRMAYYPQTQLPLARWAVPEQICMAKRENFRWQDEYRVAFGAPKNFEAYAVSTTISQADTVANAQANGLEREYSFDIGSIRSFSKKHKCM